MTLYLHTHGPNPTPQNRSLVTPIVRTLPLNRLTPAGVFRRSRWKGQGFFLDGSMGGWFDGDYSLIGGAPFGSFRSKGKFSRFDYRLQNKEQNWSHQDKPIACLQSWLTRFQMTQDCALAKADIPFLHGGLVGFFSYELAHQFEKLPRPSEALHDVPDINLLFLNFFIVIDHRKDTLHIVYNPIPEIRMGRDEKEVRRDGLEKIDALEKRLSENAPPESDFVSAPLFKLTSDCSEETYIKRVRQAKYSIAKGDIFQANLSHRFSTPSNLQSLFEIYQGLCKVNPSPFAAYLEMGEIQIASGSPERLVRVKNNAKGTIVETRPIAGTKPRGKDADEDEQLIQSLYGSEKERAEHLMLVDLERNDLGKICEYGSVRVDAMMALERYSHVSHLVSNIQGKLRPGLSPLQVLQAVFPGGTITGTPKIRCMEIISELEQRARGIYTGAIGYIGFDGEMDLNIAIRTGVQSRGELSFQVGAGIVADSDPALEYQETLHKAAAFIEVLKSVNETHSARS